MEEYKFTFYLNVENETRQITISVISSSRISAEGAAVGLLRDKYPVSYQSASMSLEKAA